MLLTVIELFSCAKSVGEHVLHFCGPQSKSYDFFLLNIVSVHCTVQCTVICIALL